MRKVVLITGAFGFVGSNLADFLAARGFEVWALDVDDNARMRECVNARVANGCSSPYVQCFNWEQLDEIPWGEVSAVVHLAGKAHDTKNASDPQSYFDINAGLTEKVYKFFSRQDAKAQNGEEKRFILFSSVKAVADRVDGVLTEDAEPSPGTPYGRSKLAAEGCCGHAVAAMTSVYCDDGVVAMASVKGEAGRCAGRGPGDYCDDGVVAMASVKKDEVPGAGKACEMAGGKEGAELLPSSSQPQCGCGKGGTALRSAGEAQSVKGEAGRCAGRVYILRPCMIHGPGNKGNLNLLYNVVRRGVPWPLGAYENRRSFAAVENVCAVVTGLLSGDVESGVYQVADDEAVSTNRLIELIAESLGRRAHVLRLPKGPISFFARAGDVLHLPLNSERLKKLTESYVVSNAKIKAALGWERMPVSAEEGMRQTLNSFADKSLVETTKNTKATKE